MEKRYVFTRKDIVKMLGGYTFYMNRKISKIEKGTISNEQLLDFIEDYFDEYEKKYGVSIGSVPADTFNPPAEENMDA